MGGMYSQRGEPEIYSARKADEGPVDNFLLKESNSRAWGSNDPPRLAFEMGWRVRDRYKGGLRPLKLIMKRQPEENTGVNESGDGKREGKG